LRRFFVQFKDAEVVGALIEKVTRVEKVTGDEDELVDVESVIVEVRLILKCCPVICSRIL